MPTQKLHSPWYSLKNLILVGSFVKFALGVTAAILMRQHNNTTHNAVNDTLWGIAVVVVIQGFIGSVASWVDGRKQEKRSHEMLEEGDAINSSANTNSAQLAITGQPVSGVATGNGQDGQADLGQSVISPNVPVTTMTDTNTLSPTLIPSTRSPTSLPGLGERLPFSQAKNSGQNERSIRNSGRNDAKWGTQQLTPALTQGNLTKNDGPSATDSRSSTFLPAPGVSVLANPKGRNEDSIMMNHAAVDKIDEIKDTQRNQSEGIGLLYPGAGPNAVAAHGHSQYNEETVDGERGTITQNELSKGANSSIHVASSTLLCALDSLVPFQAENLEVKQGMHPTNGSDGAGIQEDRETTPGGNYVAVGQHKEQIVVIHDSPLTMRNTDVSPPTASRRFPLMIGEVTEGEKKQERMKVVPHIGSPEVPQILKDSSKVTGGELVQGKCPVVQVRDFDYNSKQIFGIIIGNS